MARTQATSTLRQANTAQKHLLWLFSHNITDKLCFNKMHTMNPAMAVFVAFKNLFSTFPQLVCAKKRCCQGIPIALAPLRYSSLTHFSKTKAKSLFFTHFDSKSRF